MSINEGETFISSESNFKSFRNNPRRRLDKPYAGACSVILIGTLRRNGACLDPLQKLPADRTSVLFPKLFKHPVYKSIQFFLFLHIVCGIIPGDHPRDHRHSGDSAAGFTRAPYTSAECGSKPQRIAFAVTRCIAERCKYRLRAVSSLKKKLSCLLFTVHNAPPFRHAAFSPRVSFFIQWYLFAFIAATPHLKI